MHLTPPRSFDDRPPSRLRSTVIDVVIALALAWFMIGGWVAVNAMQGSKSWDRHDSGPPRMSDVDMPWPVLLAVALALAALVMRRRRPRLAWVVGMVAVALYLVFDGATVAAVFVAIVLALTLVRREGGIQKVWPWLTLMIPAYAAGDPLDLRHWFSVATMVIWTLLPVLFAGVMQARHDERRRSRAAELADIAHAERLRVARDIHDVVGHSLSLISLQSGVALKVLDRDPDQARASLEAIRSTSKQALDEVRRTLGVFRDEDAPLAPTPGLDAIRALVDQVHTTGASVTLDALPDASEIPTAVQTVAHRIVQEALTNALRHAPGAAIHVRLEATAAALHVTVTDRGTPAPTFVEGGGLTGMRERVAALGGRLTLTPSPTGFVVEADLPLNGAAQ